MPRATILYFASLGDLLQRERETCDLPETATSGDILACIATCHPDAASLLSTCRVAVACEFLTDRIRLRGGEEVAILPPVSGG